MNATTPARGQPTGAVKWQTAPALEAKTVRADDSEINVAFVMLACLAAAIAGVLVFILV